MNDIALSIKQLDYAYRHQWSFVRMQQLHDVNLDIQRGEAFGFLGHNGAGKTTTIKCILNLLKPLRGEISIFQELSTTPESRKHVGYLPELPYFYDHLRVSEIMNMYSTLAGVPSSERKKAISNALEKVNMLPQANAPMRTLSKGMTQRIGMAQAIVSSPELLILDEPFSGLDPIGRKEFRDMIFEMKHAGTTIFLSSHILGDVEHVCDRASIMVNGKLKGIFNLRNLSENISQGHYEITIRSSESISDELIQKASTHLVQGELITLHIKQQTQAEEILSDLLARNIPLVSYQFRHQSLENIFVDLVDQEKQHDQL